jgi:hypothetical protein
VKVDLERGGSSSSFFPKGFVLTFFLTVRRIGTVSSFVSWVIPNGLALCIFLNVRLVYLVVWLSSDSGLGKTSYFSFTGAGSSFMGSAD